MVLALTAFLFYRWGSARPSAPPAGPGASPSATRAPTTAEVYTALAPSVVTIEASAGNGAVDAGTGVVVNADGTVLTALHVVKGAGTVHLTFADGTQSSATVTASGPA